MKQLFIFDSPDQNSSEQSPKQSKSVHWKLFVDGASRNNPGPSGAGIFLVKNGEPLEQRGFFLGIKTNNQAEYLALLLGLYLVGKHFKVGDHLEVISDSQLLIRQLQGMYKVKNSDLQALHAVAKGMLAHLKHTTMHVLRNENVHADRLANEGLDKKIKVPDEFLTLLAQHNISF